METIDDDTAERAPQQEGHQGSRISHFGDGPLAAKIKALVAKFLATFKDDPARHKALTYSSRKLRPVIGD